MTIKERLGFLEVADFKLDIAIDNYLDSKEQPVRERTYFYASELGKSVNELSKVFTTKKSFKFNARVKRILDNGNYVHERFQKLFIEMGIHVASEIDVGDDLVHGRLDSIITDGKDNYIVEIKSCSQWTFNKLKKPSKQHELQLQFYMYYTNIYKGIIIYECKDNQSIKCFDVQLKKEYIEQYLKELKELKEQSIKGIEPTIQDTTLNTIQYGS